MVDLVLRMKQLLLFLALTWSFNAFGVEFRQCPNDADSVTFPAPVDIVGLKKAVLALKDTAGKTVFSASPAFEKSIEQTFDLTDVKTKMGQFYTLIWVMSEELKKQKIEKMAFSQQSVEDVLIASKVFTDKTIPSKIKTIEFELGKNKSNYKVVFSEGNIELPLNQGDGFYLFRNGKCQHAQKLIFKDTFTFQMKRNLGNLMVAEFSGVDLFGDFGNRGIIDVDIQYVTLRSVEFIGGTVDGKVTAYVSREEFKKNKHNALLELVTKIVPDRSVQPIDW